MNCAKCSIKYNNSTNKPYSIKPCGHTYCKSCLDSLDKRECPSCKTQIIDTNIVNDQIELLNETLLKNNLNEQLQSRVNKMQNEHSKLTKMLDQSKTEQLKVKQIKIEIETRKVELFKEVTTKQEKLLNDLNTASINFNNTINESKKCERSINTKLISINNSIKVSKDLSKIEKDLDLLDINSEIEKLSNANKEYEIKLDNITSDQFFNKETNENELLNQLAKEYFDQGTELFFNSKFEQAIEMINKAIALKHNYTEAYYLKGRCLGRLNKFEEAIIIYEKCIEIDPKHLLSYNMKGYMLECLSKQDEANTFYQLALEMNSNPNDSNGYFNKALSLGFLNQNEEALFWYDKAIELNSKNTLFYSFKSFSLASLKRYQESITNLDKAIELKPNYDNFYSNKAIELEKLGEYSSAIKNCNRALDLNAKNFLAYTLKLRILFEKLEQYEECIKTANKVLEKNSKYFNAYEYKISSLQKLNRNEEALKLSDYLLENYNYISNNYRHNLLMVDSKNCTEALKLVNNAIFYGVKDLFLYQIKLDNLIYLKRYEEALETVEYALRLPEQKNYDCTHSQTYKFKGDALVGLNRNIEAIESFKRALELNPNDDSLEKKIKDLL